MLLSMVSVVVMFFINLGNCSGTNVGGTDLKQNPKVAPKIISFSSTGGIIQNKDNDQDMMYLVKQGETIIFSITADKDVEYQWLVNKVDRKSNANSFRWTVPDRKSIWEIQVKASNASGGQTNLEWVISTLDKAEAPVVFDYFADGKYTGRAETDPWGRKLPEWTVRKGSPDMAGHNFGSSAPYTMMDTSSTNVYGTWEYEFRFSEGGDDYSLGIDVYLVLNNIKNDSDYSRRCYRFEKAADEHLWLDYFNTQGERCPITYGTPAMTGSGYYRIDAGDGHDGIGRDWHQMRVIHDTDGIWYLWIDDDYIPYSSHWSDELSTSTAMGLYLSQPDKRRVWIDNVRVYDTPIFPDIPDTYDSRSGTVIIRGCGNTLAKVARDINNQDIFSYNDTTKKAICNANLMFWRGAALTLSNETLTINSTAGNLKKLQLKPGWTLIMENSVIKTPDPAYPVVHERLHMDYVNKYQISETYGKLVMKKSSIKNVRELFLSSLRHLDIQDSTIENITGTHAIRFSPASYHDYYLIKNVQLSAIPPFSLTYSELNGYFYDTVFNCGQLGVRGAGNFVNCKFIDVEISEYWKPQYCRQYYLDVKVVDKKGDPVPWATVTVTNEVDDANYPAENMKTGWKWVHPTSGQTANWYRAWMDANDMRSATTGIDGHTPLPADGNNTFIITDYVKKGDSERNFTYKITASKDGKVASMSGLDIDATWYRENPNQPVKTVVCNLGTGICVPGSVSGPGHP